MASSTTHTPTATCLPRNRPTQLHRSFAEWTVLDEQQGIAVVLSHEESKKIHWAYAKKIEARVNFERLEYKVRFATRENESHLLQRQGKEYRLVCCSRVWYRDNEAVSFAGSSFQQDPVLRRPGFAVEGQEGIQEAQLEQRIRAVFPLINIDRDRFGIRLGRLFTSKVDPTFKYKAILIAEYYPASPSNEPHYTAQRKLDYNPARPCVVFDALEHPLLVLSRDHHEVLLFHGTSRLAAFSIASWGFDPNRTQRAALGPGMYLTDNLHKVTNYCKADEGSPPEDLKYLVACRVLLGNSYVARKKYKNGPYPPAEFHTLTKPCRGRLKGGDGDHTEILVREAHRILPVAVVAVKCSKKKVAN